MKILSLILDLTPVEFSPLIGGEYVFAAELKVFTILTKRTKD